MEPVLSSSVTDRPSQISIRKNNNTVKRRVLERTTSNLGLLRAFTKEEEGPWANLCGRSPMRVPRTL